MKTNWAASRNNLFALSVLLFIVTACSGGGSAFSEPTQDLIPSAATLSPTPLIPTPTPPALPAPGDVVTPTTPPENVLIPAVAQPLVDRALENLAASLNVPRDSIQLTRLESATWFSLDLGCGEVNVPGAEGLSIAGFRIVLHAGGQDYEYHTDTRSSVRRCGQEGVIVGEVETLLEVDPVAAELVALAQRQVAGRLNLPVLRIQVVEVTAIRWTNTSLGCPLPGQNYQPAEIDGYRIVLSAGDNQYLFHTDFDRVIACDPANESLPD